MRFLVRQLSTESPGRPATATEGDAREIGTPSVFHDVNRYLDVGRVFPAHGVKTMDQLKAMAIAGRDLMAVYDR